MRVIFERATGYQDCNPVEFDNEAQRNQYIADLQELGLEVEVLQGMA